MLDFDEDWYIEQEDNARHDQSLYQFEECFSRWYESNNLQSTTDFKHVARLRHLAARELMRQMPLKAELFDIVDRFAVIAPQMDEKDLVLDDPLNDFSENTCEPNSNEFYCQARQGKTMFRTSLGNYPILHERLNVTSGVIGELLDKLFSLTPLDYASTGNYDRPLEEFSRDEAITTSIVITTEYMDPELDLVYDIDGRTWKFDAELHCVRAEYTNWREIRERMMFRNGRVNKAHLILFAAERLCCLLNSIKPLSDDSDPRYNLRGYLLGILNGAICHIRIFKMLISLIPVGGGDVACDKITHGENEHGILVECRESGHRITVSTFEIPFSTLIVKAILEGTTRLDTSHVLEKFEYSEYGNNERLITLFLNTINGFEGKSASEIDTMLKRLKTNLALSLNTKYGKVRESLVCRNNGLKSGMDASMVSRLGIDYMTKFINLLKGTEFDRTENDIRRIIAISKFGICGDDEDEEICSNDKLGSSSDRALYQLQSPESYTITLKRCGKEIGKLSVVDNKFEFEKYEKARIGLLRIFQAMENVNEEDEEENMMGLGVSVEFRTFETDVTTIINACLSNVFGTQAALFVMEHILEGNVSIIKDCAPHYLQQANMSINGIRITSFLHPTVTRNLSFYKSESDEIVYFQTSKGFKKQSVEVRPETAVFGIVDTETIECDHDNETISIGERYLV